MTYFVISLLLKMKVVVAFLFVFAAATAQQKRQFGICVEECSNTVSSSRLLRSISSGIGQCPAGQKCTSNGCGHVCQPDPSASKCSNQIFCFMYCEHGYKTGPDGCQTCRCNDPPISATKCPGVMCAMFCEAGFETGKDGCPVCKCKDQAIVG